MAISCVCRPNRGVCTRTHDTRTERIGGNLDELNTFFVYDIANVIQGNVLASVLTVIANGASNVEFMRGSLAMAQANCLSFGVDWPVVLENLQRQAQIGGWVELLDAAGGHVLEVGE